MTLQDILVPLVPATLHRGSFPEFLINLEA
jgi:hypothetical protein